VLDVNCEVLMVRVDIAMDEVRLKIEELGWVEAE
jgi:RNA-splicing ligase RtcB